MATRKITRKVITPVKPPIKKEVEVPVEAPVIEEASVEVEEKGTQRVASRKECFFCKNKLNPSYTDLGNLRRYLTDRAKIVGKERSGACSKHQRLVSKNIKYARHLALLPFVPKV